MTMIQETMIQETTTKETMTGEGTAMKRGLILATLVAAPVMLGTAAFAQLPPSGGAQIVPQGGGSPQAVPQNSKVIIEYKEPSYYEPRHYLLMERMKQRRVLEEYSQFLSPLRLKDTLKITMESCGTMNSWYTQRDKKTGASPQVVVCWEWLDMIENGAAVPHDILPPNLKKMDGAGLMPGITRSEVILGGVADVLLHETGHAIFDIQGIPRLGREEDAADQMSGLIVLQFGADLARTMVRGAVNVNNHLDKIGNFNPSAMADLHALDIQRLWNSVCLAYGKDPAAFKNVADLAGLPADRRPNCKFEYEQAARAFNLTVLPDIDKELMAKVRAMPILRPEDLKL